MRETAGPEGTRGGRHSSSSARGCSIPTSPARLGPARYGPESCRHASWCQAQWRSPVPGLAATTKE